MLTNILQYRGTALEEIQVSNESLKEALQKMYDGLPVSMDFISEFKQIIPNIKSYFTTVKDELEFKPVTKLSKDQKKFMEIINEIPFAELRLLKAFKPEGLKVSYLELLDELEKEIIHCQKVDKEIIKPYIVLLGKIISQNDALKSLDTNDLNNANIEDRREKSIDRFSKLYDKDSHDVNTNVKDIIGRNADWATLFNRLNNALDSLERIDRDAIQKDIDICSEYLDIIIDKINNNQISDVTPEALRRLTNTTLQIAKEVEFLSITYFRTLTLKGSVENTIEKIKEIYA